MVYAAGFVFIVLPKQRNLYMGRRKANIEDQILNAIKQGHQTTAEIAAYLCLSKSVISKACADMTGNCLITSQSINGTYHYTLFGENLNAHDPFGLCRTQSEHQQTKSPVLRCQAQTGFGERIRHFIEDVRRGDAPETGDGSRQAYQYGKPKKLSDII